MAGVRPVSFCWTSLFVGILKFVFADQKNITAMSGQNIILPCRAPNNNKHIIVIEWSRADLGDKGYVLMYRDEQFDPENQHPSFVNRVDLQDRQMKAGDVSLILKNVTSNDTGTYECRVFTRGTNRSKRANLSNDPISIVQLSVVPPGLHGGHTEGGSVGLTLGLTVFGLLVVAVVVVFLRYRKRKQQQRRPPAAMPCSASPLKTKKHK